MGPYPLKNEVGMGVVCVTLRMSLREKIYGGNLQWESMRKLKTAWSSLFGDGLLGIGDRSFSRDWENFTETACLTRGS